MMSKSKSTGSNLPFSYRFNRDDEELEELTAEDTGDDVSPDVIPRRASSLDSEPSDAWSFLTEIKGKITKRVEDKINDLRNEKQAGKSGKMEKILEGEHVTLLDDELEQAEADSGNCHSCPETPTLKKAFREEELITPDNAKYAPSTEESKFKVGLRQRRQRFIHEHSMPNICCTMSSLLNDKCEEGIEDLKTDVECAEEAQEEWTCRDEEDTTTQQPSESSTTQHPQPTSSPRRLKAGLSVMFSMFVIFCCVCVIKVFPPSNFVLGIFLGALASSAWWYLQLLARTPPSSKTLILPRATELPTLQVPISIPEYKDVPTYTGWMNELPPPYDPDTFHFSSTQPMWVTLEGSSLRLSTPKDTFPRKASWKEGTYDSVFTHHRNFELKECQVQLLPPRLSRTRVWSRRYPIAIYFPKNDSPTKLEDPDLTFEEVTHSMCSEEVLLLFARADREKDDWYRRLCIAVQSTIKEEIPQLPLPLSLEPSQEFFKFMSERLTVLNPESREDDTEMSPAVEWVNALGGRAFYDFLSDANWNQILKEYIQRKLARIKAPPFIEALMVSEIHLGSTLPVVHKISPPRLDIRGLWVDCYVSYEGAFHMALETKVNLMKLKKSEEEGSDTSSSKDVPKDNAVSVGRIGKSSSLCDDDIEDSAESSSDEECSTSEAPEVTSEDKLPEIKIVLPKQNGKKKMLGMLMAGGGSRGKKILKLVEEVASSKYFQQATENKYIKRGVEALAKTPLALTVGVRGLAGTLTINIPPVPADRIWYGFRDNPQLLLSAKPRLGEREVTLTQVTDWIEKKLASEFEKLLVLPNMDDLIIPTLTAWNPAC